MKKTLIALAVAASAVVSGSAMAAWTVNGNGGNINIGGSLTPVTKVTPWETAVGAAVSNLNAQVQKNDTKVKVNIPKTLPILAIRSTISFTGQTGIDPVINYGFFNSGWNNSVVDVKATVLNEAGDNVGYAIFPLTAQGVSAASKLDGSEPDKKLLFANEGTGYFGGLPTSADKVLDVRNIISEGWPGIEDKYVIPNGAVWVPPAIETFSDTGWKFSSYYGSVIAKNSTMNIIMNTPVKGDDSFIWKINLPAIVTYN
ncbi:TPA: hypothetical protein ACS5XR_004069 [Salmonella enterica]